MSSSGSGPADPRHEQATSRQVPIRERKNPISLRTIIWHSALEFLLTFVLLFGVVTIVRWVIGPSAVVRAVPDIHLQLLIIGTAVGLLITGLILSPPGRASGGHMNPAISLAMRRFGVFPAIGLLAYTAAQLSGSVLGALATGAVWMGHNLAGRVDGLPGCGGPGGSTHRASPKPDRKSAPRSAPPSTTGSPPQDCAQQPDKLVSTVEAIDPKGR